MAKKKKKQFYIAFHIETDYFYDFFILFYTKQFYGFPTDFILK